MKVFGSKQPERSDEDQAALARLEAIASRFKPARSSEAEASQEPETPEDSE